LARLPLACPWLRELAAGYLPGFEVIQAESKGPYAGFRLQPRGMPAGVFVGFLTGVAPRSELHPEPPECAVGVFVEPKARAALVRRAGSLVRRSYDLVSKYSARRPRFEFYERERLSLVRHAPLASFPSRQQEKYARNFFMESLALLVRSGLPAALLVRETNKKRTSARP
jgi:hypothetical protein